MAGVKETTIQSGISSALVATTKFATGSVTINDWDILDSSAQVYAPFAIIENSDVFDAQQTTVTDTTQWNVPVTLIGRVDAQKWKASLDAFRDLRQAVIDLFNTGSYRSVGSLSGIDVQSIHNGGDIGFIYPTYASPDIVAESTPSFVSQQIIIECVEF